jgi:Na+/melibiose symporter-like transporter
MCTVAESKEAQSLHLRQNYGSGSKWRTRLVLLGMLVVTLGLGWLRFKYEVAPEDRGWFLKLFVVVAVVAFFVLFFFKRLSRRKRSEPVRLEISEQELIFTGSNGRTAMPWTAFSNCVESPALFVLLDKSKLISFAVPKRVFPDEKAKDWFRSLTKRLDNLISSPPGDVVMPGRFSAKGITLTVQLGYRDYLVRMVTSWRTKGIALAILLFATGIFLFTPAPPDAVVPPGKVFLIMMATMIPMLTVVFLIVAFVSWRSEKKFLKSQHVALSSDGIQFADGDASGLLAWTAYKYYLENRWAFFIWNPRGSLWMMFPKRQFASPMDIEQCRDLLRTNLKASRWFYM